MLPLPPYLTTTILKAHLQLFLSPGTLYPAIEKKNYKAYQKAKKHNLNRQSKHQNQAWQECWNDQMRNLKQP